MQRELAVAYFQAQSRDFHIRINISISRSTDCVMK
jgi:hypothetical protein